MKSFISTLLSFVALTSAKSSDGPSCVDFFAHVPVEAPSYPVLFPPFKDGYEATQFLLQVSKRDALTDTSLLFGPPINITTTFTISARYCSPSGSSSEYGNESPIVQVLTHGLGFDKSYWSLDGDDYNYISAATAAGYSTLSYDRLGNGLSTIPDPYTISQDLTDGVVFTGYGYNLKYLLWFEIATAFHLASENQPSKFANHSSGYLTWGDKYYNQYAFFTYPYFDPAVLEKGEAGKMPFTVGEFFTLQNIPVKAPNFAKPTLVSPFCVATAYKTNKCKVCGS